jgi:hypothetical protein
MAQDKFSIKIFLLLVKFNFFFDFLQYYPKIVDKIPSRSMYNTPSERPIIPRTVEFNSVSKDEVFFDLMGGNITLDIDEEEVSFTLKKTLDVLPAKKLPIIGRDDNSMVAGNDILEFRVYQKDRDSPITLMIYEDGNLRGLFTSSNSE